MNMSRRKKRRAEGRQKESLRGEYNNKDPEKSLVGMYTEKGIEMLMADAGYASEFMKSAVDEQGNLLSLVYVQPLNNTAICRYC